MRELDLPLVLPVHCSNVLGTARINPSMDGPLCFALVFSSTEWNEDQVVFGV